MIYEYINWPEPATIESGFTYTVELFDSQGRLKDRSVEHNMIVTQGLNHLAGVAFKSVAQNANWYIAPYTANYTPVATETAATVAASTTECTTYNEGARQAWVTGSVATGSLDNTASLAQFTFNAAQTVYGAFLVSASPIGATTGVLMSLVKFSSPKTPGIGDVLKLTAGVAFTSA